MSQYIVLARKYRPQKFDDLVGQEVIARTIKNAIELGRLPHALLLTGTRGVGKTTTARIIAKALNCEKGPTANPCGQCSNCNEITLGTNVDVYEIDGASNTSVEDIRSLKENVQYAPSKSRHKIYIIDEVHMLSTSAFNALLKTLEEPPPGVYFIFATTESHKIPDTIISRCQKHDFRQITDEQIENHLKKILSQENIQISDTAISLVAKQGHGSLRDALSLLDQVIAIAGDKITDEEVVSSLGLTDRGLITQTIEAFFDYDSKRAIDVVNRVFEKGFDSKMYLTEIWEWVRNMIVWKNTSNKDLVALSPGEFSLLESRMGQIESEELERWFDLIKSALLSIGRLEFPRYLIEITFLRITRKSRQVRIQDFLEKIDEMEKRAVPTTVANAHSKPALSVPSVPSAPQKSPSIPAQTFSADVGSDKSSASSNLEKLIAEVKKSKMSFGATLSSAKDLSWNGTLITMVFETEFLSSRAQEKDFQKCVIDLADQISNQANRIEVKTKSAAQVASAVKERPKLDVPIVQKAVSLFDATVDDIETIG